VAKRNRARVPAPQPVREHQELPVAIDRTILRIGLDADLVERARAAHGGARRSMRRALDVAINRHLRTVEDHLKAAGFVSHPAARPRVWQLSTGAIRVLDEVAARRGVARSELIRAVLTLAGNDEPGEEE
jgi:hypothetical protein